jgi:hypothetical protein
MENNHFNFLLESAIRLWFFIFAIFFAVFIFFATGVGRVVTMITFLVIVRIKFAKG